MKIKLTRQFLMEALSHVRAATATRSTLPILSHVLISAENNEISFYSTDLDLGICWSGVGEVNTKGAVAVPAKRLSDWVSYLPDGEVRVEVHEDFVLYASCGRSKIKLKGIDAKEFPSIPTLGRGSKISLDYNVLKDGVTRTAFAAASAMEPRVVLTGVLFEEGEQGLRFVATNAHRLAVWDLGKTSEPFSVILPARSLAEAVRVLGGEETVEIFVDQNLVTFQQPGRTVFTRPLEGKFPPYQQVIPESFAISWKISLHQFQQALKRVAVVAREDAGGVKLSGDGKELKVAAITQDVGEAEEVVEIAEGEGEVEVAFNVKYVLDVLPYLKGDYLWFNINSSDKPALLKGEEDGYRYIIMPMRLA